jgi:hypothetical protein
MGLALVIPNLLGPFLRIDEEGIRVRPRWRLHVTQHTWERILSIRRIAERRRVGYEIRCIDGRVVFVSTAGMFRNARRELNRILEQKFIGRMLD